MSTSDLITFNCTANRQDCLQVEREVQPGTPLYITISEPEDDKVAAVCLSEFNARRLAKHILTLYPDE
jgi:hypothetical protein